MPARVHGRVTQWFDDRGYGFVTASGGSKQVFLHVSEFNPRGTRPKIGTVVTFFLEHDREGRLRARDARSFSPDGASESGLAALCIPIMVIGAVLGLSLAGRLPWWSAGVYAGASFVAWCLYAWDKSRAELHAWRVPENTLHLVALFGGWPGAFVAQSQFRHKTRKTSFRIVFWVTVLANVGVLALVVMQGGMRAGSP